MDVLREIKAIERKADEVKTLSRLNKISILDAKVKIRGLEARLNEALKKLPQHERILYEIKKEHGDIEGV